MDSNYEIDRLDRKILEALLKDARTPFLELSRKLYVSGGTIHARVEKLKEMGVLEGSSIHINEKKLGFDVCCFIGVILKSAKDCQEVVDFIDQFDEVVEAYYTTGKYNIFIKVFAKNIEHLHTFLIAKLQSIDAVQSTETIISMKNLIHRPIRPLKKI